MSAFQYFLLEEEDLSSITAVEEQQETLSYAAEVQGLGFYALNFELFTECSCSLSDRKFSNVYVDKNYPPIYLSVPYSPPELV